MKLLMIFHVRLYDILCFPYKLIYIRIPINMYRTNLFYKLIPLYGYLTIFHINLFIIITIIIMIMIIILIIIDNMIDPINNNCLIYDINIFQAIYFIIDMIIIICNMIIIIFFLFKMIILFLSNIFFNINFIIKHNNSIPLFKITIQSL